MVLFVFMGCNAKYFLTMLFVDEMPKILLFVQDDNELIPNHPEWGSIAENLAKLRGYKRNPG